jgi:hypothetical protein
MDVIALIKKCQDALRRVTRRVLTRVAMCTDVDGGIFENVIGKLYQLCHLNSEYRY